MKLRDLTATDLDDMELERWDDWSGEWQAGAGPWWDLDGPTSLEFQPVPVSYWPAPAAN